MPVSTAPAREKRHAAAPRKRVKKKKPSLLAAWWPLLLGIAVTPFAIHAASIMALAGPAALRLLYPYVLLLKDPAVGLSGEPGNDLSQLLMYLQFPFYGALMALTLRSRGIWQAIGAAAALHFAGVLAVILIGQMHAH